MSGTCSGLVIQINLRVSSAEAGGIEFCVDSIETETCASSPAVDDGEGVFIQADYKAVGDGTTSDNAAFAAFAENYNGREMPVVLNVEAGKYVTSGYKGGWFGQYIPDLTVRGPVPLDGVWRASFVSSVRAGGKGQLESNDHSVRLEPVAAGADTVVVKAVDVSGAGRSLSDLVGLFPVGSHVAVTAYDLQGYGFPSNQQNVEIRKVVSVDLAMGEVTFDSALTFDYPETAPVYNSGADSGADLGGPATMYALDENFDRAVTFENVEWLPGTQTYMAGRSLTFRNCKTDDIGPGNAVDILIDGGVHRKFEMDKLCEQITAQDATIDALGIQSASPNRFTSLRNTVRQFNGTAGNTTIDACTITERLIVGPTAYGVGGPVTLTNTVLPADIRFTARKNSLAGHQVSGGTIRGLRHQLLTPTGTAQVGQTLTGATSGATATVAAVESATLMLNVASLSGVFQAGETVSTPTASGTLSSNRFGREWAAPGALLLLDNASGTATAATCTAFRQVGGINEIVTNLTDFPAYAGTLTQAAAHPCTNFSASGNTGADVAQVLNAHTDGDPLGTMAKLWVGADGVLRGGGFLYGKVTGVTVNVTKAYTGTRPTLLWTLNRFGAFNGVSTATGSATGFDPEFDLRQVGTRTWSPAGNVGLLGLDDDTEDSAIFLARKLDVASVDMGYYSGSALVSIADEDLSVRPEFEMTITVDPTWQPAAVVEEPEEPTVTSRTMGYYPMDEATGNFQNAILSGAYLARDASVTQVTEPNGLVLARTVDNNGSTLNIKASSADGVVLTGGQPWCVHGFVRWRSNFNSKLVMRHGGNPSPWNGGPTFHQVNNTGLFRLTTFDGIDAITPRLTNITHSNNNTLKYAAFGWDGANSFVKLSTDGTTWATSTTAMPTMQMETTQGITTFSFGGAAIDLGQICITREIPTDADLTWFANGMAGRTTSEVTTRLGTWPDLPQLPATVQTDGGTTWDETDPLNPVLLTHTGWLKNDVSVANDLFWCKPYNLRAMDPALADANGDYVWFMSSDHAGGGIVRGFSNSPSTPPASWTRIWAAGVSGEPGQTNADIAGNHVSSETPWLVYNPEDVDGRPFWLYYHDQGRSNAQNDGTSGYTSPQETRLITSATLTRGSWQYKRTVLPVRNYGPSQLWNHRGYAVVLRNSATDWEAYHLGSDRFDHTYTRSLSTDGLNWEADWFVAPPATLPYYQRWHRQQHCPPGWKLTGPQDIFDHNGQRYALGHMDVATHDTFNAWPSFRDKNQRYVWLGKIGADGLLSAPPVIVYDSNGPFYRSTLAGHNQPEKKAPHDGYIQATKCYRDGSTLHLYIKHRFESPSYIVHATVDLSPLAT